MRKRSSRNKSQIFKPHLQVEQKSNRRQKKYKTAVSNAPYETDQTNYKTFQSIVQSIIQSSSQIAQNLNEEILLFQSVLSRQIQIVLELMPENTQIQQIPKFVEDKQIMNEQNYKVREKNNLKKIISIREYDQEQQDKSQKEILYRLKRQFIAKAKVSREKRHPLSIKMQDQNLEDYIDQQYLRSVNFEKNNCKKQKTKELMQDSLRNSKMKMSQDKKYYGYEGEIVKINNDFRLKPVKNSFQEVSISISSTDIKQQINPLTMSKLKFERLSEHLSTNTFKKKIIKSEAIENYLQYTFRTNRGVNIENKKQKSARNKGYKMRLPAISQKRIMI